MAQSEKNRKDIGLIQKRDRKGNLAWYARIVRTETDGTKKQYTQKGDDKTDAKRKLKDLENQHFHRGPEGIQGERMTFRELANIYEDRRLTPTSGLKNTEGPKRFLRTVVAHLGNIRLKDLTHSDLEHFKTSRVNAPVVHAFRTKDPVTGVISVRTVQTKKDRKIASVNRELEQLRAVLGYAVEQGWLIRSPFVSRSRPLIKKADEHRRERTLSHNEESRLLAACSERPAHLKPLLICALDTAMRKSEMLKLRWEDVDFDLCIIRIKASNSKTDRARTVHITPRLVVELTSIFEKSTPDKNSLVFGIRDNVKRSFTTACRDADIEGFRLHDCRHTAITRMIAAGIPAEEVMKISGHEQIATFLRYLNPTHQSLNRAAEKLEDFNLNNQVPIEVSDAVN